MTDDPIVEEVRAERERYAASFNFDVHAIAADLRNQQQQEHRVTVNRAPRRPERRAEPAKKVG
jgi:hypothetical protein